MTTNKGNATDDFTALVSFDFLESALAEFVTFLDSEGRCRVPSRQYTLGNRKLGTTAVHKSLDYARPQLSFEPKNGQLITHKKDSAATNSMHGGIANDWTDIEKEAMANSSSRDVLDFQGVTDRIIERSPDANSFHWVVQALCLIMGVDAPRCQHRVKRNVEQRTPGGVQSDISVKSQAIQEWL
jgi:hypothetical protein